MSDSVWRLPLSGTNVAVLADCHIHESGPKFPPALFPRLEGADLIVTRGDMGDRSGLDQLQEVAPVLGVRGRDDADDMRTRRAELVLSGAGYRIGCVFDATAAGLATTSEPFVEAENAARVCQRLFGGPMPKRTKPARPLSASRARRSTRAARCSRQKELNQHSFD